MAIEEAAPRLTLTDAPGDRAQAIIRTGLSDYNLEQAGYRDARTLAVLVSDPDTQEVIGGLLGRTSMGLLFIDLFFVPESLRSNPTALIHGVQQAFIVLGIMTMASSVIFMALSPSR